MKKVVTSLLIVFALSSCKNDKKTDNGVPESQNINDTVMSSDLKTEQTTSTNQEAKTKNYPAPLQKMFMKHGSLQRWNQMNNLCFHIKGGNGDEVHTISLKNRRDKIEHKDWTIGNDGKGVWLLKNKVGYEGNPRFYNNLMFYFYAMPFVLADEGTIYKEMPQTELNGKMYNAYNVSFENGVGVSPNDQYIVYFNPETNLMEWLAYTVTFGESNKNQDLHYIKYDKWEKVNDLLLPEKLTWWKVVDGKPKSERNDLRFTDVTITETVLDNSVFAKPSEAQYVTE